MVVSSSVGSASPVKSDPPAFASGVSVLTTRQDGDGADFGQEEEEAEQTVEFPPDYSDDDDDAGEEEEEEDGGGGGAAAICLRPLPAAPPGHAPAQVAPHLATVYRIGAARMGKADGRAAGGANHHPPAMTEDLNRNLSRSEGALLMFEQDNLNSGTFPGKSLFFFTTYIRSKDSKVVSKFFSSTVCVEHQ